MPKVQRAVYAVKDLPLSGEWAFKVACEKFGPELVNTFPRYRNGPRKGMLKGYLCYIDVTVGGWAHNAPGMYYGGGVLYPGVHVWKLAIAQQYADEKQISVVATWNTAEGAKVMQTPKDAEYHFKGVSNGSWSYRLDLQFGTRRLKKT